MVVGLHAGSWHGISGLGQYLTTDGIFRIAVPIFLLINGFYFYPILSKGNSHYWFKRVLQLYLFWMLFYSYFWFIPSDGDVYASIRVPHTIIFGYFHLWYLPAMIGAATLVILVKKLSLKLIITTILITFVAGVIIQYVGNYHIVDNKMVDKFFNMTWVHRNFFFFAFPFFFIGFLINRFNIQEKISLNLAMILSILSILLLLSESYFNYIHPLKDGSFDNLMALLLVCPAIFLLFINLNLQGKSKQLSYYATGIYFIHPIFLIVYSRFTNFEGAALTFAVIVSSIIASYFLIKANNRVKFIL